MAHELPLVPFYGAVGISCAATSVLHYTMEVFPQNGIQGHNVIFCLVPYDIKEKKTLHFDPIDFSEFHIMALYIV